MSIRNKLILMLLVPLGALAVIASLGFRSQSLTASQASEAFDDNAVVGRLNNAIKTIGAERLAYVAGQDGTELGLLRQQVNDALDDVDAAVRVADFENRNITERVNNSVAEVRADVTEARFGADRVGAVVDLNRATAKLREARDLVDVDFPTSRAFAEATAADLVVDVVDTQDSIWLEYIAEDFVEDDLMNRFRVAVATTDLLREQVLDTAPDNHTARLIETITSSTNASVDRINAEAVSRYDATLTPNRLPLSDELTFDIIAESHEDWFEHAEDLQMEVEISVEKSASDAQGQQNLFGLLAGLGGLILAGLIYTIYRSVVRPLDALLSGAEDVAANRLPTVVSQLRALGSSDEGVSLAPLPRESDDELGSLVDAFNDVQLTAFDLAVEQARSRRNIAEMFVNLGRRNQKLLQRMLGVISELEHEEKDPEKLEQLFQLDHMTTRMRRNAESLLVVAGTKTPRQWTRPVPAADVVRSALAEVADYHRIDVLNLADAPMAGNAVADVTHLLAELMENSLQFSEPETRVNVSSRWLNDDDYRIVITDQGFGMTEEELAENNALISNPPPPDEAPTRFLGLFVVGHLAQRHGISVLLVDATGGGTDARITIPARLMAETTAPAAAPVDDELLGLGPDSDLDAELAKLTAETDLGSELPSRGDEPLIIPGDLPTRGEPTVVDEADVVEVEEEVVETVEDAVVEASGETIIDFDQDPFETDLEPAVEEQDATPDQDDDSSDELPTRGEVAASDELPTRGEVAPDELPTRGEVAAPADLPTRGEEPAPAEPAPAAAELPTRAPAAVMEASAFDALPTRGQETPDAPAGLATPEMPVRGESSTLTAPSADLAGLPLRQPKMALDEVAPIVPIGAKAADPVDTETEEDVSTAATSVGSMFSAFQAGVQRGETNGN